MASRSEHLSLEEAYSENRVHGWWRIRCKVGRESEDMWDALNELHDENSRLFPVPPRRWKNKNTFSREHQKTYQSENVESFTSVKSDKKQIKAAAEAIRNKIKFLFVMYYIEAPFEYNKLQKYIHTPENEFYEVENGAWKISLNDYSTEGSEKAASAAEISISKSLKSLDVKSKMNGASCTKNLSSRLFSPPPQPSTDDCLYFPSTEEAIKKMESGISGKWLVYSNFSWVKLEDMLIALIEDGILTGMKVKTSTDSEVILWCYTADANDENDVKKAGDAIRNLMPKDCIMYYKTNISSAKGEYRKHGYLSVASYMHTVNGSFYVRDKFKRWMLTKF